MAPLECVPDSEKDWHPGSNGLVLDLDHLSLYPIVYEHTMSKDLGSTTPTVLVALWPSDSTFTSEKFQ